MAASIKHESRSKNKSKRNEIRYESKRDKKLPENKYP